MVINIKNTESNYGLISVLLHWIMAIVIIGLFFLGQYMADLDYYHQWYHQAPWWHKSVGVSLFGLLLIRLFWRFIEITPQPLESYTNLEINIAKFVHRLFYLLILITCISGYFISTAKGSGIEIYGWFEIPSIMSISEAQAENAAKVHEIATWLIVTFFILHVAAALKHHLIDKDNTLGRMLIKR